MTNPVENSARHEQRMQRKARIVVDQAGDLQRQAEELCRMVADGSLPDASARLVLSKCVETHIHSRVKDPEIAGVAFRDAALAITDTTRSGSFDWSRASQITSWVNQCVRHARARVVTGGAGEGGWGLRSGQMSTIDRSTSDDNRYAPIDIQVPGAEEQYEANLYDAARQTLPAHAHRDVRWNALCSAKFAEQSMPTTDEMTPITSEHAADARRKIELVGFTETLRMAAAGQLSRKAEDLMFAHVAGYMSVKTFASRLLEDLPDYAGDAYKLSIQAATNRRLSKAEIERLERRAAAEASESVSS